MKDFHSEKNEKSKITFRLDKILSSAAIGSRKEVKKLLREDRVSWQDETLRDASRKFSLAQIEDLRFDGYPIEPIFTPVLMFNKGPDVLTAMEDRRQLTIADFLPFEWLNRDLAPIGRLDKDTSGLLLLTSDGQLNHRVASPKHEVEKEYLFIYEGAPLGQKEIEAVSAGLRLGDGTKCAPAKLLLPMPAQGAEEQVLDPTTTTSSGNLGHLFDPDAPTSAGNLGHLFDPDARPLPERFQGLWLESPATPTTSNGPWLARLILREGFFHQVKRMIERLGREVILLHRDRVGSLWLDPNLQENELRLLTEEERIPLYQEVELDLPPR